MFFAKGSKQSMSNCLNASSKAWIGKSDDGCFFLLDFQTTSRIWHDLQYSGHHSESEPIKMSQDFKASFPYTYVSSQGDVRGKTNKFMPIDFTHNVDIQLSIQPLG